MNVTALRKSTGPFTVCAKADDFSTGKRLHWSYNSGAFMECLEESCSSGHGRARHGMRVRIPSSVLLFLLAVANLLTMLFIAGHYCSISSYTYNR